ncbi:carboxypeptidase-like regulatory domain-containing protein [Neolewinella agarilytica]|uniref:Carboxypeptidase regulatory-like domain-containing protein n=1 Tax=Neolewinella agarilytica TaxID=478744 RepID=A0A1H9FBI6_9BACT|nr:carboxypeptidase-like regulatory domain-containing protein [Neolewinella agarilytica]SEQ35311.1 hypothetical protein SAMN05444359_108168 [Neolewinella agarilytica]
MSETNPNITELLRRYLSGAITAPEEAELERLARKDETLRDAMQGLQSAPEEDHLARVERMKARVRQQAGQGARTPVQSKVKGSESPAGGAVVRPLQRYRYYAAAAVLLLLISAVFLLPRFQEEAFATDVAMKTEPIQETPAPEFSPAPEPDQAAEAEAPTPLAAENEPSDLRPGAATSAAAPKPAPRQQKDVVVSSPPPPSPPVTAEEEEMNDDIAEEVFVAAPTTAAPTAPPAIRRPSPAAVQRTDEAAAKLEARAEQERASVSRSRSQRSRAEADDMSVTAATTAGISNGPSILSGRVTNENGEPVANALVRQPGLPIGQRTDSNGVFQISADATATMLDISHPDFNEERVDVKSLGADLQITLEQEKRVDYAEWKKSWESTKIPLDDTPGYALPEEGYNALRKRIEENKPEGIPAGKIKFSFLVDTDGMLSDFIFRGQPEQATMDYIGTTIMNTSIWNVVKGEEPVRVYFKVVFE